MNRNHVLQELEQHIFLIQQQGFRDPAPETFHEKLAIAKSMLADRLVEIEYEDQARRFVQYQQRTLVRLMDRLSIAEGHSYVRHPYEEGLRSFFHFLHDFFASYFDQDTHAPKIFLAHHRKILVPQFDKVRELFERERADARLAELTLMPLRQVIQSENISYRMVTYARALAEEVDTFWEGEAIDEALRQLLCYLNYNSPSVTSYFADYYAADLHQRESRAEKIQRVAFFLKKVNQTPTKPGLALYGDAPSLRDYLSGYLLEEMQYLEKEHAPFPGAARKEEISSGFKLKMEISVAQVAYLLKVFLEMKVIQNNNLTEVLRFVTGFVTTKKAEQISFESVRGKYYAVENGTRASIRELLVKMVRHIDRS